jgi:hypothetical protein
MNQTMRLYTRAAGVVVGALIRRRNGSLASAMTTIDPLSESIARLVTIRRQIIAAISRGYLPAAGVLTRRARWQLRDMPYQLEIVQRAFGSESGPLPGLSEIVRELGQLAQEFDAVQVRPHSISVTTAPIELQGVYLGPFCIELELAAMANDRSCPYVVIALDPQPATGHPEITHPHVIDERLCEGDATVPIASAISEGRICDLMLIIRSALTTYNASSAYASLDEWLGVACYDCGEPMAADDTYWCQGCGCDYCASCTTSCSDCGRITCLNCASVCARCGQEICQSCSSSCPTCGKNLCPACLEDQGCPCKDKEPVDDRQAITQNA